MTFPDIVRYVDHCIKINMSFKKWFMNQYYIDIMRVINNSSSGINYDMDFSASEINCLLFKLEPSDIQDILHAMIKIVIMGESFE